MDTLDYYFQVFYLGYSVQALFYEDLLELVDAGYYVCIFIATNIAIDIDCAICVIVTVTVTAIIDIHIVRVMVRQYLNDTKTIHHCALLLNPRHDGLQLLNQC